MVKNDHIDNGNACPSGEDIVAYLQNELGQEEQRVVARHLSSCPSCGKEAGSFRSVISRLEMDKQAAVSRDLVPSVMARLSDESGTGGTVIRFWLLRVAACLLIAVGIGYAVYISLHTRGMIQHGRRGPAGSVVSSGEARDSGLAWLVSAQDQSGKWDPGRWGGRREYTVGLTGMALLSLVRTDADFEGKDLSAGRAIDYLLAQQSEAGRFGDDFDGTMYNHGIATVALMEAYDHTRNSELMGPIRSALDFIRSQQLRSGGWGYKKAIGEEANTSISVWPLQALMLAQREGLSDEGYALKRGLRWLVGVVDDRGQFGYSQPEQFPQGPESLTAMGAYCLLLAAHEGFEISPRVKMKVERALSAGPAHHTDFYRTYFQICALSQSNADKWADSMARLQTDLVNQRQGTGRHEGSWDPRDQWGPVGGRIYSTALSALSLGAAPCEDS